MRWTVPYYELPAPANVIAKMKRESEPLAELVGLPPNEIVAKLRDKLRFDDHPHLHRLANAVLELPLSCLSVYEGEFWLSFNALENPISIQGTRRIPVALFDTFPVRSIPSLEDFLRHFGGLVDGYLPPGACFNPPTACYTVRSNDENWGLAGEWEGAMELYHGSTGDRIVIRPNGKIASWSHEIGWSCRDRSPFTKLDGDFASLIDHFAELVGRPFDSVERKASPFYC